MHKVYRVWQKIKCCVGRHHPSKHDAWYDRANGLWSSHCKRCGGMVIWEG